MAHRNLTGLGVELVIVGVSTELEATPEGMYRMDRLRDAARTELELLTPAARELVGELEAELDRRIIHGA